VSVEVDSEESEDGKGVTYGSWTLETYNKAYFLLKSASVNSLGIIGDSVNWYIVIPRANNEGKKSQIL